MTILIVGILIFFGLHIYTAFRSREPDRDIVQKIGELTFKSIYSIGSIIGFVMIIYGYAIARSGSPITAFPQLHMFVLALMWIAMVLLTAAYLPMGYIKRFVRHPMVISIGLWGFAHLLTGIDRAGFLLFGSFLLFCLIDLVALKRRGEMRVSSAAPSVRGDILAVIIGTLAYLVLALGLHGIAFGVPVWL